ncbi:MAG: UDP-N-acetylmuramate dehydrogenase [Oscillospiraceae bacterium]|nr:UDP-N-acetylmuramate dehydrogenase [Oscillospiraceae bacterium]
MTDRIAAVAARLPQVEQRTEESLKNHTSFRIGGNAELMLFPKSEMELAAAIAAAREENVPFRILGGGTNVLAPDEDLRGVVICLKDCLCGLRLLDETRIEAYAGETMARLAVFARNRGLAGLEFAHGIPGTVGGGIFMNAGAYGGELCQVAETVTVLDQNGAICTVPCNGHTFGYRTSIFQNGEIIVRAVFRLQKGDPAAIRAKMEELMQKRKASQPLELPSAGSAFKRPQNGYAAAMIDEAGLKGFRIGGAAVSEKHAGFIVNLGGATAKDVKAVLGHVSDAVLARTGIRLEPEVRIWEA